MFSVKDLLGQERGGDALGKISDMLGANPKVTNSAIQTALPVILGGSG